MIDLLIFIGILLAFFVWPMLPHTTATVAGMAVLYGVALWWSNRVNLMILRRGKKRLR